VIDIEPGHQVVVEITGWSQTVVAPDIVVSVDPATDQVTGAGPANSFVEVYVRSYSPWLRLPTGGDGHFLANFAGLVDIGSGTEVEVAIYDDNWNRLYAVGVAPYARANIVWDNVDGWYGPDVTVWYTVTDEFGAYKGGGSGTTRPDDWSPAQPDIQAEDWVYGRLDNGLTSQVQIGTIGGQVSSADDSVSGTVYAPWFSQVLDVDCHSWGKPGDEIMQWDTVLPDGVDLYTCAWDPVAEWDILPGQNVGVGYSGPDGNWVANVFYERIQNHIYLPLLCKKH
jgi:hypothetical protein